MNFFKSADDQGMGQFILSEIRDLRKGMEGRDGELRGEITAVRDAVATLSESVSSSHSSVRVIRQDVDTMSGDLKKVRTDVDQLTAALSMKAVKDEAAWNGPKRILMNMALVGGGVGMVLAILNLAPKIMPYVIF
jgi:hypothetical protein